VMLLAGEKSIREVIAFPKTTAAQDLMAESPSEVDAPQEDALELMAAWPRLPKICWSLAGYCDDLLRIVQSECLLSTQPVDNHFQQAMAIILGKASGDARAAVKLAKAGYGPQSAGLCRSLVEGAINSRYIEKDPENRGDAFLKSIHDEKPRLIKRLNRHPHSMEVSEAIKEHKDLGTRSGWPDNVAARAHDVEDPSYSYDLVFMMLSQLLHSNVISVAGRLREIEPGHWVMESQKSAQWVDTALFTAFVYFQSIVEVAYKAFGLPLTNVRTVTQRFEAFNAQHANQVSESPTP